MQIDGNRLLRDLNALRDFGRTGAGVVRQSLSPADLESREWLAKQFAQAGLTPTIDGVGNVFGESSAHSRCVLIGSHTDTQPQGGWLDGSLGVIYGLEIARTFNEKPGHAALGVDVVSWMDEEGTFGHSLGSRSFCGMLEDDELASAVRAGGASFLQALRQSGYDQKPRKRVKCSRHVGYLEAHIEQGPVLEAENKQVGVVTSIVGAREFVIAITGQQNHAGTTPMNLRRDAGICMCHLVSKLDTDFTKAAEHDVVWTFGRICLRPNAPSIVPGSAEVSVQFRCGSSEVLDRFERILQHRLESLERANPQLQIESRETIRFAPTPMDDRMIEVLAKAARRHAGDGWKYMPSGAGHDAQFLAERVPAGMLFIPSVGGVSHSFDEESRDEDIVKGCQVLADAVRHLTQSPDLQGLS